MLLFILYVISGFVCFIIYRHMYRKLDSLNEKSLYLLGCIMYITPILIYIFDRFNIPTLFFGGVDSARWFDFVTTYVSTVIGAVANGIVLLLITIQQMKIQTFDSDESRRVQNFPLFKYSFPSKCNKSFMEHTLWSKDGNEYQLLMNIDNVGLNHAIKVGFTSIVDDVSSDYLCTCSAVGEQSILKVNENINLKLIFRLPYYKDNSNRHYITIKVFYDDLINNKYVQNIDLTVDIFEPYYKQHNLTIVKCDILDAKLLSDEE